MSIGDRTAKVEARRLYPPLPFVTILGMYDLRSNDSPYEYCVLHRVGSLDYRALIFIKRFIPRAVCVTAKSPSFLKKITTGSLKVFFRNRESSRRVTARRSKLKIPEHVTKIGPCRIRPFQCSARMFCSDFSLFVRVEKNACSLVRRNFCATSFFGMPNVPTVIDLGD